MSAPGGGNSRRQRDLDRQGRSLMLMAIVLVVCSAAFILVLAPYAPGANPMGPAVANCALGKLTPSLRKALPRSLAREQRRYVRSLTGAAEATRKRAAKVFAAGAAAYVYGMPTVLFRRTVSNFPHNVMVGIAELATPESRTVVAPNHDTMYTVSQLDLRDGPMVIDAPATGGRYSVLQLLDAYTNAFSYIGAGAERERAASVAVVPPGWQGGLPEGVRVVEAPTKLVWLLGRTLVDGPEDVAAAKATMEGYALTPLADWQAGTRVAAAVLDAYPGTRPVVAMPEGLEFFDELGEALAADPPPARDECALTVFARYGIGPGLSPSQGADDVDAAALVAAAAAGDRLSDRAIKTYRRHSRREHDNWTLSAPNTARFGTDYGYRAAVARVGLAANVRKEAFYPNTDRDHRGRPLQGRHGYVVRFAPGELPPVRSFWSLTMYDRDIFLVDNPIDRYAIGDRTAGLRRTRRGGLNIYVQHDPPAAKRRSNWLPSPSGRFELHLRLYEPKRAAYNGDWHPPRVRRFG